MAKERKLKVYSATRTSSGSGYWGRTNYTEVPSIVLAGKWLEEAGFSIADHVSVSVEDGKLVISKLDAAAE